MTSPKVKLEYLNRPLVAGCSICYKPSVPHCSGWGMDQNKVKFFPMMVSVRLGGFYHNDVCSKSSCFWCLVFISFFDAIKTGRDIMTDNLGWLAIGRACVGGSSTLPWPLAPLQSRPPNEVKGARWWQLCFVKRKTSIFTITGPSVHRKFEIFLDSFNRVSLSGLYISFLSADMGLAELWICLKRPF